MARLALLLAAAWFAVVGPADNRDLTGIWIGPYTPNLSRGITLQFQPGAEETYRNHRGEDDPTARCLPPGIPRALGSPFPIEILQDATSVTILYEYMHLIRRIPTDGRGPRYLFAFARSRGPLVGQIAEYLRHRLTSPPVAVETLAPEPVAHV